MMPIMNKRSTIDIKVITKSSRSKIIAAEDGSIRVYLNSPPVDGQANKECIELFSKKLKISKSSITIEKGMKAKNKKICIEGLDYPEILKQLIIK
jgi:uncharacterized protein